MIILSQKICPKCKQTKDIVDMATPLIRLLTPKSEHWNNLPDRPKRAVKVEV